MSVELEPTELGFRRPLTREVSEILRISNPHNSPVIFKVKTTAPRRYCVRPNSGRIEPGSHIDVQVLLQAMKEEPPLDAKCKDKFLVLSTIVTADKDFSNIASIWQEVERVSKSTIQERKIRVNYLPAETELAKEEPNGLDSREEEQPPGYTSPAPAKYDTPAANRTVNLDSSPPQSQEPAQPRSLDSPSQAQHQETGKPATENILTPQSSRDSTNPNEDLLGQLSEAKAQIQKLKQQVAENELRQRKVEKTATSEPGLQQQQISQPPAEQGVPLQVVAGLCLLSFLLAYIFF
ncbi:hypothetical protein VTO42DRAFT_8802 [Malbranchea cinnamomea]